MTEEEYEALEDKNYKLGHIGGLDEASRWLLDQAGEFFKQGNDEKANLFRGCAKEISQKSKNRREKYEKDYPLKG